MMKRIIKKIIIYTWQWLYLRGAFPSLNNKAVIFMLHRMSSPDVIEQGHSPDFLDKALFYLKSKGYNFVSLEQLFDAAEGKIELPKKAIAFTLDDGYEDQAEIAAPIFIKHQCPVTIFLITNFIDTGNSPWDSLVKHVFINSEKDEISLEVEGQQYHYNLSNLDERYKSLRDFRKKCKEFSQDNLNDILIELLNVAGIKEISLPLSSARPLTWKNARELERQGVSCAPHTENHVILSKASDDLARQEIVGAWNRISEELEHPCPVYAYPTGRKRDFTCRDINLIRELNLKGAVTAEPGYFSLDETTEVDNYLVERMSFPETIESLTKYTSRLEYVLNKLRGFKFKLKHHGNRYVLNSLLYRLKYYSGFYTKYENIDWKKVNRLVFVCKGNICRSAYAEKKAQGLGINAISIGLQTKPGSPADKQAIENASYRNVILNDHRARVINTIDIQPSDLVVCMEPWHINEFEQTHSNKCQVTLLGLWLVRQSVLIDDPYGKPDRYFQGIFREIDFSIEKISKNMLKHA